MPSSPASPGSTTKRALPEKMDSCALTTSTVRKLSAMHDSAREKKKAAVLADRGCNVLVFSAFLFRLLGLAVFPQGRDLGGHHGEFRLRLGDVDLVLGVLQRFLGGSLRFVGL